VIEGLRVLPWFQDASRREAASLGHLSNCDDCMSTTTSIERQHMGCGFEPMLEVSRPFAPRGVPCKVTVCPGYSTRLPEVIEVSRAYLHWDKGTMRERFAGAEPTPALLDGLELLQGSVRALESYLATPEKERR
jgi:hypothetical protein